LATTTTTSPCTLSIHSRFLRLLHRLPDRLRVPLAEPLVVPLAAALAVLLAEGVAEEVETTMTMTTLAVLRVLEPSRSTSHPPDRRHSI
jgi:hypothetical protein